MIDPITEALIDAAAKTLAQSYVAYDKAKDAEAKDIQDAARKHESMSGGYWETRHHLEERLRASKRIYDALVVARMDDPS